MSKFLKWFDSKPRIVRAVIFGAMCGTGYFIFIMLSLGLGGVM